MMDSSKDSGLVASCSNRSGRRFASRVVRAFGSVALGSLVALGSIPSAQAGNAALNITITPLPDTVSLSRNLNATYAAFQIDLANNSGNTLNAVVFSGTALGDQGSTAYKEYVSSATAGQPTSCTGSGVQFACSVGQMKDSSTASVVVVFAAPTSGTSITTQVTATYSTAGSASSTPSSITYSPTSGIVVTALVDPTTDPLVNSRVFSYVPSTGTGLCTGLDCIPSGSNPGTVGVNVPTTPVGGLATLGLATDGSPTCAGGFKCNTATVTAPGTYPNLTVTLRRNPNYMAPGLKIENAPVTYTFDGGNTVDITKNFCVGYDIGKPQPPTAPVDSEGVAHPELAVPCIAYQKIYPNNYKLIPALSGVLERIFFGLHNGKFSM